MGEHDPTMRCLECGLRWSATDSRQGNEVDLEKTFKELRAILERYLYPIYAGMISSELFSDYPSENAGAVRSYLRLKEIVGVSQGCSRDQVESVLMYRAKYPEEYSRITRELAYQVAALSLSGRGATQSLYDNLFTASALLFNASPMAHGDFYSESRERFETAIRQGNIGFE